MCSEDVALLKLVRPDGGVLPDWQPGAHLDLCITPDLIRQYSLCGDPSDRRSWLLGVLREVQGRGGSAHVHDVLAVGDTVHAAGLRNNFPLAASPAYLFIAGGIGITPLLPMLAQAEATGAEWSLVYGGRRRASMAFLPELAVYGDRVSVRPQDETGLLDLDGLLGVARAETLVYCCGPEPLLAAVEAKAKHWPAGALRVERFKPKQADQSEATTSFEVVLQRSGTTIRVRHDQSILEAVKEAGIYQPSFCEEGTCGTCETAVLQGEPEHRDSLLTDDEQAANDTMMICVSRSRTPVLVLDL